MAESERSVSDAGRIIGGQKDGFKIFITKSLLIEQLKTHLRPKLVPGHGSFHLLKTESEYVQEV